MNNEKLNKLKYYILSGLELALFTIIIYILLESIKYGSFTNCFNCMYIVLEKGSRYILTAILIVIGFSLLIRSVTKNNFLCNLIIALLLLCITLISFYKYVALEQPFVPYDILLAGNLNQISEFGFTGITLQMFLAILLLAITLVIDYFINKKIEDKINLTIIKRAIIFVTGITIIFITCVSPNRYKNFKIKNDNGDNYVWMGANAVFFMHLGDFYSPKPERI